MFRNKPETCFVFEIAPLHLQNFYDFWYTSTPFYSETSVDSKFMKFIKQSGATWRKLLTLDFAFEKLGILRFGVYRRLRSSMTDKHSRAATYHNT